MKGCAPSLAFITRYKETRKWLICRDTNGTGITCSTFVCCDWMILLFLLSGKSSITELNICQKTPIFATVCTRREK